MTTDESNACIPVPIDLNAFNPLAILPYSLTINHVYEAMTEFIGFLAFMNQQLAGRQIPRLKQFLMPASFSGLVGEYLNVAIPKYCPTLVRNIYHHGHPDLVPAGMFERNAVQYTHEGIEVKASRYTRGWQGHNPEAIWLLVFTFDANSSNDIVHNVSPRAFRFTGVFAAPLTLQDWNYSGRSATSRRTITASVNPGGMAKMKANWVYTWSRET